VLSIKYVSRFKKDFKKYQHQTIVLQELNDIFKMLMAEKKLPEKYRDHFLSGGYSGMRECHVKPDVLLIYWIDEKNKKLIVERLGSHSELF
jgi:mRNA interferase YafQ